MNKKYLSTLIACALVGMSSSVLASTITNLDLTNASPFGGFDWSSNGTAVSSPGPAYHSGDAITTLFFADAKTIDKTGGGSFATPNLILSAPGGGAFGAGQYEYTVVATILETIDCGPTGTLCSGASSFTATGGSYNIYYDYSGAAGGNTIANQITGTGFTDGDLLLSGTIDPGFAGIFVPTGTGGSGFFQFAGGVTSTNSTYIQPNQTASSAFSTLQFGTSVSNWTPATGTPNGALPASNIQFQADGNQAFTATTVPEPGTLFLLGSALLGLGVVARKQPRA